MRMAHGGTIRMMGKVGGNTVVSRFIFVLIVFWCECLVLDYFNLKKLKKLEKQEKEKKNPLE